MINEETTKEFGYRPYWISSEDRLVSLYEKREDNITYRWGTLPFSEAIAVSQSIESFKKAFTPLSEWLNNFCEEGHRIRKAVEVGSYWLNESGRLVTVHRSNEDELFCYYGDAVKTTRGKDFSRIDHTNFYLNMSRFNGNTNEFDRDGYLVRPDQRPNQGKTND